jgi:hypothetical protein
MILERKFHRVLAAALLIVGSQTPSWAVEANPAGEGKPRECTVSCIEPHGCCAESDKVIGVLRTLVDAYVKCDVNGVAQYLDENCTGFSERTKRLVVGKENILNELQKLRSEHAAEGSSPLISFTIDQPYARLAPDGQECTVMFWAKRKFGGEHPLTEEKHAIDVFVKRGDAWKMLHCVGVWKKSRQ